jgi:hypothetical protein
MASVAKVHPAVAAPEALFTHEGADVSFGAFKDIITNKATTVVRAAPISAPHHLAHSHSARS